MNRAEDEPPVVVIDLGSCMCRAGFQGEDEPLSLFPTVIGKATSSGRFIGKDAWSRRDTLGLSYPIQDGIITNWDDMEKIWHHIFAELKVNPKDHVVLHTEPPMTSKADREKLTQIMFEKFQVPALYVASQATMALFASGRTTGVIYDAGDGVSHAVPIYEGHPLPHATTRVGIGGRDLTQYMSTLLTEGGHRLPVNGGKEIAADMKEKLCYVALDFNKAMQTNPVTLKENYNLPDGQNIAIDTERFRVPEALFKPGLVGLEVASIPQAVHDSISKCDPDLHKSLYLNITLSGGSILFPGTADRLEVELAPLAQAGLRVRVRGILRESRFSAWNGASALAAYPVLKQMCIKKKEYKAHGPTIVNKKCF